MAMSAGLQSRLTQISGGFVFVMALFFMVGWISGQDHWVQWVPGMVPIQFNTALAFALCAIALLGVSQRGSMARMVAPLVAIAVVALLVTLTMWQYLVDTDLGVDQLLVKAAILDRTASPGRMAPATAVAFLLSVVALTLLILGHRLRIPVFWAQACSGTALLLVVQGCLEGLLRDPSARVVMLTDVAPQTALLMALLSAAIMVQARSGLVDDELRRIDRYLAWGSLLLAGLVFVVWQNLERNEWRERDTDVALALQTVVQNLSASIHTPGVALQRLAERHDIYGEPTQVEWEREVSLLLRDFPALVAVVYADAQYIIRWRVARDGQQMLIGSSLNIDPLRNATYQAASSERRVRLTPAVELRSGGLGIAYVAPMFAGETLAGFVSTSIRADELLDWIGGPILQDYGVRLRDTRRVIAGEMVERDARIPQLVRKVDLDALGQTWTVEVWPKSTYLARMRSRLPESALLFGLLTVLLVTIASVQLRRNAAARSRASRLDARLSSTLEAISDAFLLLGRDWSVMYLNRRGEQLLQRQFEDLRERNVWDEFPDVKGSTFEREYRRAIEENRSVEFEEFYPPLKAWFGVRVYPVEEGLAVYFRDVTEKRAINAHLQLLEAAISRLSDIVLITEAEPIDEPGPRIVFVNEAFEQLTGYTRDEVIGRSPRVLQGPKTERAELDRIRTALKAWQPVRAEVTNYTKAGKEIHLELDIVPIADSTGWYTHWVSVERDVTERRALEEQLRQSQRLESIGQLTGGVAHDFNNLLTVILGNSELLSETQPAGSRDRVLAEMVMSAAQRGAELTRHLLAFARKQALDPTVLDVNMMVGNMDALLRRTLGEHIEVELVRGGGLWLTLVDRAQLESALLNLAINSRDAMIDGGQLTIETANARLDDDYCAQYPDVRPGQYVMLAVSDTGAGIAPEYLPRVFEPFFTTKEKGKGTGLGLAMVYGFIKQSGGHLNIYSEPGQGTTVKLYLPRADVDEHVAEDSERGGMVIGGSEVILVVEDDDLVRRFACGQLTALGYRVIEAADGPSALEILRTNPRIDLLFTDVVMPGGMSGRQLADEAHKLRPDLRVLYTSGYTENAIVHHGRLDPGVQLLGKPYRRAELARRVRKVLATR